VLEPGLLGVGAFAVVGLGGGRTGRSGDRVAPWAARPDGAGSAPAWSPVSRSRRGPPPARRSHRQARAGCPVRDPRLDQLRLPHEVSAELSSKVSSA